MKELECSWCGNIITVVKKPYKVMSDHMSKQHTKAWNDELKSLLDDQFAEVN